MKQLSYLKNSGENKIILVDFSQVILSSIIVNLRDQVKKPDENTKGLIKHMFFSILLSYKKQFKDYGEIVLACDGRKYWRKDYFPNYKGHRAKARDKDPMDWEYIFATIDELKTDIRENFKYKMIEIPAAEADDVIACIVKWLQENELVQEGLFDNEPQKIMIVSSDGDFVQLQKYSNVKQYSPMAKKQVKPKEPLKEYIMDHIVRGDAGDGVPNILSPDNSIVDSIRQKPITKKFFQEFLNRGFDACINDELKRNFKRNQTLVDFDYIPESVFKDVINSYTEYKISGNVNKILAYFIKNKMKLLMASATEY
jgi:hypothetical protein